MRSAEYFLPRMNTVNTDLLATNLRECSQINVDRVAMRPAMTPEGLMTAKPNDRRRRNDAQPMTPAGPMTRPNNVTM